MNDEPSFLAAIAAHRGDETLVLAFADWLEEQGDPRAPWVRTRQVREWMGPSFGDPIPALVESLRNNRRVIQVRRVCALIGAPIVPALVELLDHASPRVRQQATICLRKIGRQARAAVPALLGSLKDPHAAVREAAAKALKDIGPEAGTDTSLLREALADEHHGVRSAAAQVLGSMRARPDVAGELERQLASSNPGVRTTAIAALGQLASAEAVGPLDRMLDDPLPEIRIAAVRALGKMPKVGAAIAPLCRALGDADANVRLAAAEQFGLFGHTPNDEAIAPLRQALGDVSAKVRQQAAVALQRGGKRSVSAIPELIGNLAHEDVGVRLAVVQALGHVGKDEPGVLAALIPTIDDEAAQVAARAVEALGNWTRLPNAAAGPLLRYLRRAQENRSWESPTHVAFSAMSRLEKPTGRVLAEVRRAVARIDSSDCWHACEALGAIGPAAAVGVPELVECVRGGGPIEAAVPALVRIGGEGITHLGALIESSEHLQRILRALFPIGPAALPLLGSMLRRLRTTADEWETILVLEAIRYLGPVAIDAIPDLLTLAEGPARPDDRVRNSALDILSYLDSGLGPFLGRILALSLRTDQQANHRAAFGVILGRLSLRVPEAMTALVEQFEATAPAPDDDLNVQWAKSQFRHGAVSTLAALGPAAAPAVPMILTLLDDPRADSQRLAIEALGLIGDPVAVTRVCQAARSSDGMLRGAVARALGGLGDRSNAVVAVLVSMTSDGSSFVRASAIESLGRLQVNTKAALEALRNAEKRDPERRVRVAATAALKAIEGPRRKRK